MKTPPLTPVLDRLNQHGRVRALVFGNHGEASPDVYPTSIISSQQRLVNWLATHRHLGSKGSAGCALWGWGIRLPCSAVQAWCWHRSCEGVCTLSPLACAVHWCATCCTAVCMYVRDHHSVRATWGEGGSSRGPHAGRLLQAPGWHLAGGGGL